MIVLACGDRKWSDRVLVEKTLEYLRTHRPEPLTVIEGGAPGCRSSGWSVGSEDAEERRRMGPGAC